MWLNLALAHRIQIQHPRIGTQDTWNEHTV
jgi:hypothetical protein